MLTDSYVFILLNSTNNLQFLMFLADLDECHKKSYHDCSQMCINTEGGFYCFCEEGYQLLSDNKTCEGMNV